MARSEVVGGAFVFTSASCKWDAALTCWPLIADEFVNFVLDQLSSLPELRAKAMFGGYGLYQGDRFFGIMMARRLYFKTNEKTVRKYLDHGMGPFLYEKARQTMTIQYYEVPPAILENRSDFVIWAREAIEAEKIKRLKRK